MIFLQINSKCSEIHKTGDVAFLLAAGASSHPFLDPDNVILSYHTEFHQILSINKCWSRETDKSLS